MNVLLRTVIPILLLIGTGLLSRKINVLQMGDERVLSAYLYYFALPALFFINMAETQFTPQKVTFMAAGWVPILLALGILTTSYFIFSFSREILYLLILSTVFGSLAFFGIPFISFAFPEEGEAIATLATVSISPFSVMLSILTLELYKMGQTKIWTALKIVGKRLSKNPLIISIIAGILFSISGIYIPLYISTPLHMLGGTTDTVAIFMLGVFLYGRKYTNLPEALKLSMLRMIFLPSIAFFTTLLFNLPTIQRSTLILLHGMPVAISMIILSERYNFYKKTIASLILIMSLAAGLYLNLWLLLLGQY